MTGSTNSFVGGLAPAVKVEPDTGGGATDNETPDDGGTTSGEIISLPVLNQTQYENGSVSSSFGSRHLVGSSHYNTTADGVPYNFYNLWMCYALSIPQTCSEINFSASYNTPMNSAAIVADSPYRYSVGSASSPGSSYKTFYWNTSQKTMSGSVTGEFQAGTTVYLWLHYSYAGNNNCYVEGVSLKSVTGVTS